jgi:DNA (cytosine-5)-methyltransferase 1
MVPDDAGLVFDHITRAVRDDDREAFVLMGDGARYKDLPDHLKRYRDDIFDDKYNRLEWDKWSRSITAHIAKDGYWYIHPSEPRTLTVREAARVQTFPDHFRFSGSRSDAFRQIGNAVPPILAESVARAILTSARQPQRKSSVRPSAARAKVRAELLSWAATTPKPAWRTVGEPWDVLVGVIAGRGSELQAELLLETFPTPESVVPQQVSALVSRSSDARRGRVLQYVGKASTAIKRDGWEKGTWVASGHLGPADRQWVEVVGLGQKHVAATTGTMRVAARVMGQEDGSGVGGRMVLAQLVGHSDDASAITAALAGVGTDICVPTEPECGRCPLSGVCQTRIAGLATWATPQRESAAAG